MTYDAAPARSGSGRTVGYNGAASRAQRPHPNHGDPIVYSREYLGFIPLALLPIALGATFILLALIWPR